MAEMSKEEQIAFHRGSLNALGGEQAELIKLVNMVQQIAQAHIKALKELGVDVEAEAKKATEEYKKQQEAKAKQPAAGDALADRLG